MRHTCVFRMSSQSRTDPKSLFLLLQSIQKPFAHQYYRSAGTRREAEVPLTTASFDWVGLAFVNASEISDGRWFWRYKKPPEKTMSTSRHCVFPNKHKIDFRQCFILLNV